MDVLVLRTPITANVRNATECRHCIDGDSNNISFLSHSKPNKAKHTTSYWRGGCIVVLYIHCLTHTGPTDRL